MPYLSHLLDAKILDSADVVIGRLRDVAVAPEEGKYVPLAYLKVEKKKSGQIIYVPYEYVENFSKEEVSLRTILRKVPHKEEISNEYLFLRQDVFDQQIVDISGARVVRVNDLRIGDFDGKMSILGIDISTKGLLRRLGIEWLDVFDLLTSHLIDWRQAQPIHRMLKLDTVSKSLHKLHPADLANIIEDLSVKRGRDFVSSLDAKDAAEVLQEINPHLRKILVKYLGPEKAADILGQMSPEEVVDLMQMLPKEEAKLFLANLDDNNKVKKVERLIKYPNDTAGGLMSVDFVAVRPGCTVRHAREEVKKMSDKLNSIVYVYVTEEDSTFVGVISLRWLLISNASKTIKNLMKKCAPHSTLKLDQNIEEIIPIMTRYNLYTVAVLDDNKKLVGVVTIDDVMRHLVPYA